MSDGTEKRERRQFEPPPWEREAFDELAKKRAEGPSPAAPLPTAQQPAAPVVTAAEIAASMPPQAAQAAPGDEALTPEQASATAKIANAQVDAMLMSLAAEEPRLTHDWTIGLWVAAVLGLFGSGVVLYGLIAMTRGVSLAAPDNKPAALMMGVLTAGVGAILLGMAAWVGLRAWKRRGE